MAHREDRSDRDPLLLAARQSLHRPLGEPRGPGDHHRLLRPGCDLGRWMAEVLEPEGDLAARPPHDQLAFGVLEHKPRHAGDLAWDVVAGVHALCGHPPLQAAAVEVRDEAGGGAQER